MNTTPVHTFEAFRLLGVLSVLALASAVAAQSAPPSPRGVFTIAPVVEGILLCDEATVRTATRGTFDAASHCGVRGYDAAAALMQALDALEPGGPAGSVQVGYTLPVPLLSLYRADGKGGWTLDTARLDRILALVSRVPRPVVVYLLADHFDTQGPLTDVLVRDAPSLMHLRDGTAPIADYFGNRIVPYTLQPDADIAVNRYRFAALHEVAKKLTALPRPVRDRIVAVTLAGELHHLFKDFEAGMGAHASIEVTDYSPASVAGFRRWLAQRYGTVEKLNQAHGFAFAAFADVPAPSKDIRREPLQSFAQHYDGFAGGTLPVSGWLWDPQRRVRALDVYLNGQRVGPVDRFLNRLDVYRAVAEIDDPNVGFRNDLSFASLEPGRHSVQLVAVVDGKDRLAAEFEFRVVPRDQAKPVDRAPRRVTGLPLLGAVPGVRSYLDLPAKGQDVYFNPLARDWNAYRDSQPTAMLQKFFDVARAAGLPADKLFSHQIVPQVNSTWNPLLFAGDSTHRGDAPWRPGINLYGGAADSPWVTQWIAAKGLKDYGVPEFNPQQWKRPGVHTRALQRHFDGGARFVSPYYMSITSALKIDKFPALKAMEIRADNPTEGSSQFYQAIREFAAR